MPALTFLFLTLLSPLHLIKITHASPNFLHHVCSNTTTYTSNTPYKTNLNLVLSTLSSNSTHLFYQNTTANIGGGNSTVYGHSLCRGDINNTECNLCVSTAAKEIVNRCPVGKAAFIRYEQCFLRYSDQNFFGKMRTVPAKNVTGKAKIPQEQIDSFNKVLTDTMKKTAEEAVRGGSTEKEIKYFATKEANAYPFRTLYTLVQCTQDIFNWDCSRCLADAMELLPTCCNGMKSGKVMFPSCFIRYELYLFYYHTTSSTGGPLSPPTDTATMAKGEKSKPSALVITAIVLLSVFSILLLANLSCVLRRRATMYNALRHDFNGGNNITSIQSLQFDFKTLQTATSNFSDSKKLGQGGFGEVYKGMLLNGQEIAVKRLSKNSIQGAEEFKNEVLLMAKLQHRNLAKLLGFCLEGDEKVLVYEYVPNRSLDHFLFDPKTQDQLDWSTRCQVIEGIARGILYLHEDSRLKIIHRDLKASNILLDFNLNAKISDFGTARLFGIDQTQGNTQKIAGTYGYMAPEYVATGQYSVKSDVFSFGVLLLEILSGRRNSSFDQDSTPSLIAHAWHLWNQEKGLELMDPIMRETCPISDEFMRYLNIGLLCVQGHPNKRPNMSSVVLMLQSEALSLLQPGQPAFFAEGFTVQYEMPIQEFSNNSISVSDFGAR